MKTIRREVGGINFERMKECLIENNALIMDTVYPPRYSFTTLNSIFVQVRNGVMNIWIKK